MFSVKWEQDFKAWLDKRFTYLGYENTCVKTLFHSSYCYINIVRFSSLVITHDTFKHNMPFCHFMQKERERELIGCGRTHFVFLQQTLAYCYAVIYNQSYKLVIHRFKVISLHFLVTSFIRTHRLRFILLHFTLFIKIYLIFFPLWVDVRFVTRKESLMWADVESN